MGAFGAFDGGAFDSVAFDIGVVTTDDILDFNVYKIFDIDANLSISKTKEVILNMTKEVDR